MLRRLPATLSLVASLTVSVAAEAVETTQPASAAPAVTETQPGEPVWPAEMRYAKPAAETAEAPKVTPVAVAEEQAPVWPAEMRNATPAAAEKPATSATTTPPLAVPETTATIPSEPVAPPSAVVTTTPAAAAQAGDAARDPASQDAAAPPTVTAMPANPELPSTPAASTTAQPAQPADTANSMSPKADDINGQAVLVNVRTALGEPVKGLDDAEKADRATLAKFYAERQSPLWVHADQPTTRALAVVATLRSADEWGLSAKDLDVPELSLGASLSVSRQAAIEMSLSAAALKYVRHARGGRIPDPRQMSSYLDRDPQLVPSDTVLAALAASADPAAVLVGYQPQHPQFQRLKKKLAELRGAAEAAEREAVSMPTEGPLLAPGKTHPDVAILRQRLKAGAPPAGADGTPGNSDFYDKELEAAVKAYQRENGMTVDGLVGRNTRAALNGGSRKVDEGLLIANMEAWRWMPEDLGNVHVWVNLPEYLVRVVKKGEVIHEERIIAGEIDKQTPVFSHELETVVIHPFWGVPESIKVRELLPSLARGSSLERRGLRLQYNGRDIDATSVDWSRADIRNYHVYQPPGGGNVLGVVKFLFPNKHQVYMHDTPTKPLFNSTQRTFSHGCMRVRNPLKLAEIVLREDKGWGPEKLRSLVDSGPENNNITLESKIPVHVTYFTAWVDDNGELQTRPDMYSHEKRIRLALAGKWDKIPRHRDHLLPVEYVRPQVVYQDNNALSDFFSTLFGGF